MSRYYIEEDLQPQHIEEESQVLKLSRRVSLAGYLTGAFLGVITATPIARAVFGDIMPAGFAEASFILSCFLIGLFALFVIKG